MLKNITMFHVKDHVSIPNRRKPVGNHKRSTSVHQFCKCFLDTKEYTQALTTLDELLSHTKAANSYRSLQVLKDRAHILTLMGNSKEACEAYEIFNTYKDSLDAMNYIRQINELHTLYQIDKNELDNLNRQKTILYWSWFTILFIVILIVFFILLVRRGNKKLRQSQQELEKAKKEIREKDAEIDRQSKIAGVFCKAYEKAVLLTPTEENVRICFLQMPQNLHPLPFPGMLQSSPVQED